MILEIGGKAPWICTGIRILLICYVSHHSPTLRYRDIFITIHLTTVYSSHRCTSEILRISQLTSHPRLISEVFHYPHVSVSSRRSMTMTLTIVHCSKVWSTTLKKYVQMCFTPHILCLGKTLQDHLKQGQACHMHLVTWHISTYGCWQSLSLSKRTFLLRMTSSSGCSWKADPTTPWVPEPLIWTGHVPSAQEWGNTEDAQMTKCCPGEAPLGGVMAASTASGSLGYSTQGLSNRTLCHRSTRPLWPDISDPRPPHLSPEAPWLLNVSDVQTQ